MKIILLLASLLSFVPASHAEISDDVGNRFSLSGGLIYINNPSQTVFSISAEYEYRLSGFFGVGTQVSHVFSTNAITQLAIPTGYLHPLGGDWFVSASPVFYFISGSKNLTGARFMTRIPLDLSILTFVPTIGIDIIDGGPNYILGLALSI